MKANAGGLKKSLNLFQLTIYGVGTIIGAGIYSVVAPATAVAGSSIWLSFILAAIASSFSALSYAELASALPSAGAEHSFLKNAFPRFPIIAFLTGCFIAVHGAATLATVALTFAGYLMTYFTSNKTVIAISIICAFTLVNIKGLSWASKFNTVFTVIQISGLVALIIGGFTHPSAIEVISKVVSEPKNLSDVLGATAIVFFIYTGYEHMASLSEEAKHPDKDIPRAFILALAITTFVYLGVIFSILILTNAKSISTSDSPLRLAATARFSWLGEIVTVAALLATANAVLSGSLSGSRLLFGMARSGDLPAAIKKKTVAHKSPWVAALVVLFGACVFVIVGEIKFVASLSSLGALLVFALVNSAVVFLRITKPDLKRPFRVPGTVAQIPLLSLMGILISVILSVQYEPKVYLVFFGACTLGVAAYYFSSRSRTK